MLDKRLRSDVFLRGRIFVLNPPRNPIGPTSGVPPPQPVRAASLICGQRRAADTHAGRPAMLKAYSLIATPLNDATPIEFDVATGVRPP